MPNYDNENCQSCRYCIDVDFCALPGVDRDQWPDLRTHCEDIELSLECRKVRALEEIAKQAKKEGA